MSLIVFDFDGTIADSVVIFIEATNHLAKEFGYLPLAPDQLPDLRRLSLQGMARQLGIPRWKLPFFLRRFRQELTGLLIDLKLIDGMHTALMAIHHQGYHLGIVTANSRQNVEHFLRQEQIRPLFEFIDGGQILAGKVRSLKKLAKLNPVNPKHLIYIGDEINDIKAAKQVGVTSIAVTWGFNDRTALATLAPDFLVDHPDQLLAAITQVHPPLGSPPSPSPPSWQGRKRDFS
ncbi:MAG: HAD-IA family hydrolase [Acaryochloris sp. RU_4_1]|nr:HAD-IA family hydrolase [Acaryochloris sp. RU_4_1]NJN38843.1 HAD-IA family hydrolase [Acaryochloridaceae cyanobacterium CSU_3_4]NJR54873.1 HAD-IA family hydrolase [Acaryochloris sp. CRU_2_0]